MSLCDNKKVFIAKYGPFSAELYVAIVLLDVIGDFKKTLCSGENARLVVGKHTDVQA